MAVNLDRAAFPAFSDPVRARWAPVILSPIRGSIERLVIGVAVFDGGEFHIEAANALGRLQCLYGSQGDVVIEVAGVALDQLHFALASRGVDAILDSRPSMTGLTVGDIRAAEGRSLEAIGVSWMRALSSLYDHTAEGVTLEADDPDATYESRFEALSGGDRLPKLVLEFVSGERLGLSKFFRDDLSGRVRRRRNNEVSIDFAGSRLVANFGTLQAGQTARSVDLIKRRLWDVKVDRDAGGPEVFRREHEMLIQMPAQDDPQVNDKQFENLETARQALEEQADQEELRLQAFTSVVEIGKRVLEAELAVS